MDKIKIKDELAEKIKKDVSYTWLVGSRIDKVDKTEEFIKKGIWKNGYSNKYFNLVNKIKVGDRIVIKSTYTRKNKVPFENNGKTVSVLAIKAIGIVVKNYKDGKNLDVNWLEINPKREWYKYVYRNTIKKIEKDNSKKEKELIEFIFQNKKQDYSNFINNSINNRKEKIIEILNEHDVIKPDEHDASYELVRENMKLYEGHKNYNRYDFQFIYTSTIGNWKYKSESRYALIDKTSLSDKKKERAKKILKYILKNVKKGKYKNHFETDEIKFGMFGTGYYGISEKDFNQEWLKNFFDICNNIINKKISSTKALEKISNMKNQKGVAIATISQILHCISPNDFLIINSPVIDNYEYLNVLSDGKIESKKDLKDIRKYKENTLILKKLMNERTNKDNFRVLDLVLYNIIKTEKQYYFFCSNPQIASQNGNTYKLNSEVKIYKSTKNKETIKAFNSIKEEDLVVVYSTKPIQKIIAYAKVLEKEKDLIKIKIIREVNGPKIETVKKNNVFKNNIRNYLDNSRTLYRIYEKEYKELLNLSESSKYNNDKKFEVNNNKLYFEKEIKNKIEKQVNFAIKKNKNIILLGAPGTGKTKLAKQICEHIKGNDFNIVTGNSDWSTFDTIGGYIPNEKGNLNFEPGLFLKAIKDNRWLIIDEINRTDIDKAFGALFTVMGGDNITLNFKDNKGENITVSKGKQDNTSHYKIKDDWKLIATMNTLDKTSLYEMSYAFMRRFSFINVPVPKDIDEKLVKNYLEIWNINNKDYSDKMSSLWKIFNEFRKIGPALIKDLYEYLVYSKGDYASAINMYIIPQLEGLMKDELNKLKSQLKNELEESQYEKVENFIEDFLV